LTGELPAELLDADDWFDILIPCFADYFVELRKFSNIRHCHADELCVEAKEKISVIHFFSNPNSNWSI
jgi:hypothetical protein